MSTIAQAQPIASPAGPADPGIYRFTVAEYERMVLDDPRVELIDGQVVRKMGKNPPHSWTTKALIRHVPGVIPIGWTWRVEQPVRISDHDEPEPDFSIVRGTDDDYQDRHPGPADVAVLIEVSESTLPHDRGKRLSRSALHRIPVYWIINLVERRVEVYTDPRPDGYGLCTPYHEGQAIPVVIDGVEFGPIPVDQLLPPRRPTRP
jgi:Uma2 family endonuclease